MSKLPDAPSVLDPWLGTGRILAHPNSAAGGGGPGQFVVPGVLGAAQNGLNSFPHPQSPAARGVYVASNGSLAALAGHRKSNTQGKRAKVMPAPKTREMTVVGSFPSYWSTQSDAKILQTLRGHKSRPNDEWSPGTKELQDFARKGASPGDIVVSTEFQDLLYRLGTQPPKSITRLNVITHANEGWISFSGKVQRDGVTLEGIHLNAVTGKPEVHNFDKAFMEDAEDPQMVYSPAGWSKEDTYAKGVSIGDVRAAFSDDAKVVIYACHAGLDKSYLQSIAHLFGVPVQGFSKMIVYTPIPDSTSRHIAKMEYGVEGSAASTQNFHSLTPDVEVAPAAKP